MAGSSLTFTPVRDNQGMNVSSSSTVATGVRGVLCGGVFLGYGHGCLYTRDSDGHILWSVSTDQTTWSSGTDTGMTGQVASLVYTTSGELVGLIWDWDGTTGAKTCKACRSRDRGGTWEIDGSAISIIPALDHPPALVCEAQTVYAVWISSNAPILAASVDGGLSWT